jgi:hypothetical protein
MSMANRAPGPQNIDTGVVEISLKICINHWDTCGKFATLALKLLPMPKTQLSSLTTISIAHI